MEQKPGAFAGLATEHQIGHLSVRGLSICIGGRAVVSDLSFDVAQGEIVALLGRDGAGKTSCFQSLAGLMRAESGGIILNGSDLTRRTIDQRARMGLAYVPEDVSVFTGLTVAENILLALEACEPVADVRISRLDILLADFHLSYVRDQLATTLSGGERRRCEFARAMALRPSILLLDEPFRGLDPTSISSVKNAITDLKTRDVGVLVSEYDLHDLSDVIDRAYVIDRGRLIFSGNMQHLLADATVRHVYLGESFSL